MENASQIEINLIEIEADNVGFKIDGKQLILNGLSKVPNDAVDWEFTKTFEKTIETPDIVLKKYQEAQK